MIQIRRGVFETSSSSVHSICICPEDEYDCWADDMRSINRNSYLLDDWRDCLVPIEEVLSDIPIRFEDAEEVGFACVNNRRYMTKKDYDGYCGKEWFEMYSKKFLSPSDDKMIAFGYYGHD